MARWITVTSPFEYRWPDRSAITVFTQANLGEHLVKDEIADFAVEREFATEGKAEGSTTRSTKSGPKAVRSRSPRRRKAATKAADEVTANPGLYNRLDGEDLADADRSEAGATVDSTGG